MIKKSVKDNDKKDLKFQKKEKINKSKDSPESEEINSNMINKILIKSISLDICANLDLKKLELAMECPSIPLLYSIIRILSAINKSFKMNNTSLRNL